MQAWRGNRGYKIAIIIIILIIITKNADYCKYDYKKSRKQKHKLVSLLTAYSL